MEWLKLWLEKLSLIQTGHDGVGDMSQMVARLNINRRKYARVRVPMGKGLGLPIFMVHGHVLEIIDLSEGGVCLGDPSEVISIALGEACELQLSWGQSHSVEVIQARVVGQSRMHYKHLQFSNLSINNQTRISMLTRAGSAGSRMKKSPLNFSPDIQSPMSEIWTGFGSDHLIFQNEGPFDAVLSINACLLKIHHDGQIVGLPAPDMLSEVLVFLENINKPSSRVVSLSHRIMARTEPEVGDQAS